MKKKEERGLGRQTDRLTDMRPREREKMARKDKKMMREIKGRSFVVFWFDEFHQWRLGV